MVNTLVLIQKFQRIYEPTHCDSLPKRGLCTRTTHSPKLWPNGQSFCRPRDSCLGEEPDVTGVSVRAESVEGSASWELVKAPIVWSWSVRVLSDWSTAWFLQERGVEVTVVDRDGVAADASWGNAGWLAPALTLPPARTRSAPIRLARDAQPVVPGVRATDHRSEADSVPGRVRAPLHAVEVAGSDVGLHRGQTEQPWARTTNSPTVASKN